MFILKPLNRASLFVTRRSRNYPAGATAEQRFWQHVDRRGAHACWEWTGSTDGGGYGRFVIDDQPFPAHRVSYVLHAEEIPAGMLVCHHCDNPRCVNPGHLFIGTPKANMEDREKKGRSNHPPQAGSMNNRARLRPSEVAEIRQRRTEGVTTAEIADTFGISTSHVRKIVRRARWQAVTETEPEARR